MTWQTVTHEKPCPICGKPDWCGRTTDGAVRCMREHVALPGWRVINTDANGGTTFRPDDPDPPPPAPRTNPSGGGGPKPGTHPSFDAAVNAAARRLRGSCVTSWRYQDEAGDDAFFICRFETQGQERSKQYRPIHQNGTGWRIADPPGPLPLPLYRLPELGNADPVFIVEGEKCADALAALGFTVTTSAHGSKSAHKTDWQPLAGRDCIIIPDADAPGANYAEAVAGILLKLEPPARVRVLHLPDLAAGSGEDVVDFIEDRRADAKDDAAIRREIEDLATLCKPLHSLPDAPAAEVARPASLRWRPFPTAVLPKPLRDLVSACASAMNCDEAYVALPALALCAAGIGNARTIQLQRTWSEPAILWCVGIGRSGVKKSPPMEFVLSGLNRQQRAAMRQHDELLGVYEHDLLTYERDLAAWKKQKSSDDPPIKPTMPTCARYVVADTTMEALATVLQENPRGLLLARDELAGWFKGFDAYRGGKGGDEAKWLELHRAGMLLVDRKTGVARTLCVPRAAVSICGTIQPGTLRRALQREHFESGLAARLLLAMPPARLHRWSEAELPEYTERSFAEVMERLRNLPAGMDAFGEIEPVPLPLTPAAKREWIAFYNAHAEAQADAADDDVAAAFSKLQGYAARLALVIHCVRIVAGEANGDAIDEESVACGVALAQWFAHETQRIYDILRGDEESETKRRLVEWIQRRDGSTTVRELSRGPREYASTETAKAALNGLVQSGEGYWCQPKPGPAGGRPSAVFTLADTLTADETPADTGVTEGIVSVSTVSSFQTQDAIPDRGAA